MIFYSNMPKNLHHLHINSFGYQKCNQNNKEILITKTQGYQAWTKIYKSYAEYQIDLLKTLFDNFPDNKNLFLNKLIPFMSRLQQYQVN